MPTSLDDRHAILWADERSRLPADHPQHISREARDLIFSRALARMEAQVDAMIEAVLRELDGRPRCPAERS